MAEWSIATVLKTAEGHTSGGSNPSLSAESCKSPTYSFFAYKKERDENPGFVIAPPALSERSAERIPLFPQKSSPHGCF